MIETTSRRRRILAAFFYFSLVVFVYLLTYRGSIQTDDEQLFAAVAQNLAFHGRFSAEQLSGNSRLAGEYNGSGIAHVAIGALAARLLDPTDIGFVQGLLLTPVLYAALTGTLLFLFVCESGYPIRFAFLAACIFSFASIAWVYSQGYFRETLAALFVAGSLYFGRRWALSDPAAKRAVPIAGFLLSLAGMVLTKASLILVVPAIVFALFYGQSFDQTTRRYIYRVLLLAAAAIIAAIFIARAAIPSAVPTHYDFPRSILATIQLIFARPQDRFVLNMLASIFSPGGGLLFFSPILFLGLFSWNHAGQEWRGYTIAAIWSVAVIIVLEAAVYGNEGWSLVWGPRRLLPVLPLILISGVPLFDALVKSSKKWVRVALGLILAVSVGIQLGGVLISRTLQRTALDHEIGDFFSDRLVWSFRYSPVAYTWKLVLDGVSPDIAIVISNQSEPPARFLDAAAFFDENILEKDGVIIDHYLSPAWGFFFNHNGSRHIAWYSLPVPGEKFRPLKLAAFRTAIAGISSRDSIWILSENPEFEVSESFVHLAEILDPYTLVSVEGFSDDPSDPSIIFFHFQRLDD